MIKSTLIQSDLIKQLRYSPETGVFTLNVSKKRLKLGAIAGCKDIINGYIKITIFGKPYLAHRLAFLYVEGEFPQAQVDHINHVRDDNRWENLRPATHTTNQQNRSMNANNISGVCGVHWNKAAKKWVANIRIDGKRKHLGRFVSFDDAVAARVSANIKYGFHFNHGNKGAFL